MEGNVWHEETVTLPWVSHIGADNSDGCSFPSATSKRDLKTGEIHLCRRDVGVNALVIPEAPFHGAAWCVNLLSIHLPYCPVFPRGCLRAVKAHQPFPRICLFQRKVFCNSFDFVTLHHSSI